MGVFLAPETRFLCSERGAKKEAKTEKARVRVVGKIGGTEAGGGHRVGKSGAANEKAN